MNTKYLNAKNGIEIWHNDGITQLLAGVDDPSVVGKVAEIGSIYMSSSTSGTIYKKSGTSDFDWTADYDWSSEVESIRNFIALQDTPTTYSGSANKVLAVNSSASAVEFIDIPGGYPRHYIEQNIHVNVHAWGQYVIHDAALEIAGALEIGAGGMIILT